MIINTPFSNAVAQGAQSFADYAKLRGATLKHEFYQNGVFFSNFNPHDKWNILQSITLLQDAPEVRRTIADWITGAQDYIAKPVHLTNAEVDQILNTFLTDIPELHGFLATLWRCSSELADQWLTPKIQEVLIPHYLKANVLTQLVASWYRVENHLHLWAWLDKDLPELKQPTQLAELFTSLARRSDFRKIASFCALCPELAKHASKAQQQRLPLLAKLHDFYHHICQPSPEDYQKLLQWPFADQKHFWPFNSIGLKHRDAIEHKVQTPFHWPSNGTTRTEQTKGLSGVSFEIGHTYIKAIEKNQTWIVATRVTENACIFTGETKRAAAVVRQWLINDGQQLIQIVGPPKNTDDPNRTLRQQADNYLRTIIYGYRDGDDINIRYVGTALDQIGIAAFSPEVMQETREAVKAIENQIRFNFQRAPNNEQRSLSDVQILKDLTTILPGYDLAADLIAYVL